MLVAFVRREHNTHFVDLALRADAGMLVERGQGKRGGGWGKLAVHLPDSCGAWCVVHHTSFLRAAYHCDGNHVEDDANCGGIGTERRIGLRVHWTLAQKLHLWLRHRHIDGVDRPYGAANQQSREHHDASVIPKLTLIKFYQNNLK